MYYSERFIVSGGIFEYYKYDRLLNDTRMPAGGGRKEGQNVGKYRGDVVQKAKKEVRRLINSNVDRWTDDNGEKVTAKFITLTFRENITDIKAANHEFLLFIKRISYELGYKVKYLAVVEFQDGKEYTDRATGQHRKGSGRGAVHYHVVMFNMPYFSQNKLQNIWGNGWVFINKIDNVDNVGAYVCKYMTKSNEDSRLAGHKMYFKSTGLLQPENIKDYGDVQKLKKALLNDCERKYETEFEAPYVGKIQYAQYIIKK